MKFIVVARKDISNNVKFSSLWYVSSHFISLAVFMNDFSVNDTFELIILES